MSDYNSKLALFDENVKALNSLFLPSSKKVELLKQIDANIQELFASIPKGDESAKKALIGRVDTVSTFISKSMPRLFAKLFPNQTRESLALMASAVRVKKELSTEGVKPVISPLEMKAVRKKASLAFEMVKTHRTDYLLNKVAVMDLVLELGNVLTDVEFALEHCSDDKEKQEVIKIVQDIETFFEGLKKDKDLLFQPYTYLEREGDKRAFVPHMVRNKEGQLVELHPAKEVLEISKSITSKSTS